jgi:hypothetical protein
VTVKDVKARSDDDSMDPVVSQLNSHISQLDSNLQTFKAQTTRQIAHFRGKANHDINAARAEFTAQLDALNGTIAAHGPAVQDAATFVFVHWGSDACEATSELVYSGVAGGSPFNQTGAATNFLCLTMEPTFTANSKEQHGAHLYGSEYQTDDAHNDMDPVCAVCRAPYSTTVMIPGTSACTTGWHRQYTGFLMAGGYGDASGSEFICVDQALASADHSFQNQDGKSLFYTDTHCGSLPCTPYEENRTVLCVVCSK